MIIIDLSQGLHSWCSKVKKSIILWSKEMFIHQMRFSNLRSGIYSIIVKCYLQEVVKYWLAAWEILGNGLNAIYPMLPGLHSADVWSHRFVTTDSVTVKTLYNHKCWMKVLRPHPHVHCWSWQQLQLSEEVTGRFHTVWASCTCQVTGWVYI